MAGTPSGPLSPDDLVRIREAWEELRPAEQPRDPERLLSFLEELHSYPHSGIVIQDRRTAHIARENITAAYSKFVDSAKELATCLYSLDPGYYLLDDKLFDVKSFEHRYALRHLEKTLPEFLELPSLHADERRQPRLQPHSYARAVALAVGWHTIHRESGEFRGTFGNDGRPTSREAKILEAILMALRVENYELETIYRSARKQLISEDNPLDEWAIFRAFALAFSSEDTVSGSPRKQRGNQNDYPEQPDQP